MLFALGDLTTPLTRQQVEASIYDVLATVGVNTATWKPGASVRTVIVGSSVVLAAFSRLTAVIARSGFLELAEGQWLTLVARYVYRIERFEATFAEGELTLTNTGGGIFALDPGDLIVANTATGRHFRNTQPVELRPNSSVTVPIRAAETGAASTSLAGTITTLVTPLLGVTCSNALAVIGQDDEADPDLRARCSEKLGSLSPFGPPDAYGFAARNATTPDGLRVGVTRVRASRDGAGGVTLWVAKAAGAVPGDAGDASTELGAVAAAVARGAVPECVTATVLSATPTTVAVTYEAWAYEVDDLSDEQLEAAIAQRLAEAFAGQPIGGNVIGLDPGRLFRTAIITAIGSAHASIFRIDMPTPATDVELEIGAVPVLGTVTATIHRVARPDAAAA